MNQKELGRVIKQKRLSLNFTMDFVAYNLGISRVTLSSIENGTANYGIDILFKLLKFLNLDLSIDTISIPNPKRKRAKKINSILNKKTNRFSILLIEQYASYSGKSGKEVYARLSKQGILEEIEKDYEDLHGMSIAYLNDYIDKMLGRKENDSKQPAKPLDHLLAKSILITNVVELIAKERTTTLKNIRDILYGSELINLIEDDETGLYGESPIYIASLFKSDK